MSSIYAVSAFSSFASFGVFFLVAMVLGGRSDADRSTRRPYAIYLSSVLFMAVFGLLGLATAMVAPFVDRISSTSSDYGSSSEGVHVAFRNLLIVLIIAVPVVLLFRFHWRLRSGMRAESGFVGSPQARTDRVFIYAVCFSSIITAAITGVVCAINFITLLFPTFMSESSDRSGATQGFLTLLIPVAGALFIFRTFWAQAADDRPKSATINTSSTDSGESTTTATDTIAT